MSETIKSQLVIQDWPTQLAVLKAMYNSDDLHVKYLDEESEEVGIENQHDLDYAYQIALNATNGSLKLIIRNSRNEILGKQILNIDMDTLKKIKSNREKKLSESNIEFSEAQIKWLENYLQNFKQNIYADFESKIDNLINKKLILFDEIDNYVELKKKVNILFNIINESRLANRSLKAAYYEEELESTQAFAAEFIKDFNMPDGSQCEPNMKFRKTWLIKNIGKLDWLAQNYQIKLINISGNIKTEYDFVNVDDTKINETVSVSVDLMAPSKPGNYFSEWVLCCNGFKFGPRIWCSIRVKGEKSLINDSDNDDEFVVIPACFDLSKKWSLDSNDTKDELLSDKSDTISKSIQPESGETETLSESKNSDSEDERGITKANQITHAFDMMKNAFSNLGRPSFVGSIDFMETNDERSKLNNMNELMSKLISMGFADRVKNRKLLKEFNYDLEKVLQQLLDDMDNNWAENR